jgi:hypothetical protein
MSKIVLRSILGLALMLTSSGSKVLAADLLRVAPTGSLGSSPSAGSARESVSSGSSTSSGGSSSSGSTDTKSLTSPSTIPGTQIPSTVTHLVITNKTASAVTIGVQCQLPGALVQDGCTTNISDMSIIDLTAGGSSSPQSFTTYSAYNPGQGVFTLASMHQYEIINTKTNPFSVPANQQQNCLQGLIVSFNQWNSCPTTPPPAFPVPFVAGPAIPNGSNAAEPTLNIPGTISGTAVGGSAATEATDITCVNGANSILKLTITSPSQAPTGGSQALPWLYDASGSIGAGQSFSTRNSWVNVADKCDDNCYMTVNGNNVDRPGVYPYGCTQCNVNPDPKPPCAQYCAAQNGLSANKGCNFNRSPQTTNSSTAQFGGTVEFSYLSPAVPTVNCQGMGQP